VHYDLLLVAQSREGHRQAYIDQFRSLTKGSGISCAVVHDWKDSFGFPGPVLFLMIEESFFGYFLSAIYRSLFARRTTGLLFRGREAVEGRGIRLKIKGWMLRVLKAAPSITTLSIVPFLVCEGLAALADDWIDDPQLWDLEDLATHSTPLSSSIAEKASGRKLLVSLGAQNESKGLNFLIQTWIARTDIQEQWLFVVAGKVSPDMGARAADFTKAGGVVVNRFISDDELRSLYGAAAVVWGVYAPHYDQASGIFGRAVQYDKPVLLRRGSSIARHAEFLGARAVAIDYGIPESVVEGLQQAVHSPPSTSSSSQEMRSRSLALVLAGLGQNV
jgi:hypothetical protein